MYIHCRYLTLSAILLRMNFQTPFDALNNQPTTQGVSYAYSRALSGFLQRTLLAVAH